MSEPNTASQLELKSLRDRPFELLAELERRGRAVSAQLNQEATSGREWVGVALRMAGDLYLVAREETREVLGVPSSTTRVPGAKPWIKGLANVMHGGEGMAARGGIHRGVKLRARRLEIRAKVRGAAKRPGGTAMKIQPSAPVKSPGPIRSQSRQ